MSVSRTGGGAFDPSDPFVYFIASNIDRMRFGAEVHDHLLVAINELKSDNELAYVEQWIAQGKKVFIDSGVYNLAMEHARKHDVTHDVALALAPDEIDGFAELFERYVTVIRRLGEPAWGYIEIDQGGRENKVKTRARLEALGLRPIPVYHPFSDGWDYFDELAGQYDRICFGNVVQASRAERVRFVATAWERRRRYPDLWIHLLGLTPNEWLNALPVSSGDSSAWLAALRWSGYNERADGRSLGPLLRDFQYELGSDPTSSVGSQRACAMSAYGARMAMLNWRNHLRDLENLGCELYPEPK